VVHLHLRTIHHLATVGVEAAVAVGLVVAAALTARNIIGTEIL